MVMLLVLVASGSLALQGFVRSTTEDQVTGIWVTGDQEGKIEIFKVGSKFYGKIVWGKDMYEADGKTPRKDTKNDDPAKRNRPLKGLIILSGFVYRNGGYEDGTIYDPNNGKTYDCKMKLSGNDRLEIRGYIGLSLFGRTETWTRAKQ